MGEGFVTSCSTDPEALILLTSLCGLKDPRLLEVMDIWLKYYEPIIMIERIKRCAETISPKNKVGYRRLAALKFLLELNFPKSRMKRWDAFFGILDEKEIGIKEDYSSPKTIESRKKLKDHQYIVQNNLQIALRYLLGANARADVLYYAIVTTYQKINPYSLLITPSEAASLLHFDYSSVYRILTDLERAGIIIDEPALKMKPGELCYYLNKNSLFSSCPTNLIEKCYIDWFPLIELVDEFYRFQESIQNIEDEALVKARIDRMLTTATQLIMKARIQIQTSIPRNAPLVNIPLEKLEEELVSIFDQMKIFLVVGEG